VEDLPARRLNASARSERQGTGDADVPYPAARPRLLRSCGDRFTSDDAKGDADMARLGSRRSQTLSSIAATSGPRTPLKQPGLLRCTHLHTDFSSESTLYCT
jgi:hypothetical protein